MEIKEKNFIKKDRLEVGDVLVHPLLNSKGITLLPAGSVITEKNLSHLANINERLIYYVEPQSKLSEFVKNETIDAIINKNVEKLSEQAKIITRQIIERDVHEIDYEDIDKNDKKLYTANHSLNVATISCIIAKSMGYDEFDLEKITFAGLLHDFMKFEEVDKVTIEKYRKETNIDNVLDYMTYYSLEKDYNIKSEDVLYSILNHHTHFNNIKNDVKDSKKQIFSSILHLSDIYDTLINQDIEAIVSDLPGNMLYLFEKKFGGFTRQNIIYFFRTDPTNFDSKKLFDPEVINHFFKSVSVYNVDSKVILSNGDVAVVKRNFEGFTDKPELKIVDSKNLERIDQIINLNDRENLNLIIRDYYKEPENNNVLKK